MKIRCDLTKLRHVISVATTATGRSQMPVLNSLLFDVQPINPTAARLEITGTDLDLSARADMEVVVTDKKEKPFSFCLYGHRTLTILREMVGNEVTMELLENGMVVLECGPSTYRLYAISGEEFPKVDMNWDGTKLELKQADLLRCLNAVVRARCKDEARHNIAGIAMEKTGEELTFVATDGRRMHIASVLHDLKENFKVVLPAAAVSDLCGLLSENGNVTLVLDKPPGGARRRMLARIDDKVSAAVMFMTKLDEAEFPSWSRILPNSDGWAKATVNRAEMMGGVHRMLSAGRAKGPSMTVMTGGMGVELATLSENGEEATDLVACKYEGSPGKFAVNPQYMLEALDACIEDSVQMRIAASNPDLSPSLVIAPGFTAIVMPQKL